MIYLDYNATAPLLPTVAERMQALLGEAQGNPSSPHRSGQDARDRLETARQTLAAALGVDRRSVLFTSGGSESNNTVLRWLATLDGPAHVITSPLEHPSVVRCCEWLQTQGVAVDWLPVGPDGVADVEALPALLRPETRVVSLMAANNETGVLQPVARLTELVRQAELEQPVLVHTDAVQAFGRVPLPLADWGVDGATVAAHKLGGPKGIGVLVLRNPEAVPPLVWGGAQERGRRAGTESVLLAEGFAAAVDWVGEHRDELAARLTDMRARLVGHLADAPGFFVNGAEAPRVPNTVNLGFEGVSAQSLLVALDLAGVAVSMGSACSSGAMEPSPVLRAMGLPRERLEASLRVSLGWGTTQADVDQAAEVMLREAGRLRQSRRRAS